MENKDKKFVKLIIITLPLQLLGCKQDAKLYVEICADGHIEISMPISTENLDSALIPLTGMNLPVFHFEEKELSESCLEFACFELGFRYYHILTMAAMRKICKLDD